MFRTRSNTETESADWLTISILLGGLLLLYYVVPLLTLAVSQSPQSLLARIGERTVLVAATNSLLTATASTAVATAFGLPLAYWLARTDVGWRNVVTGVVVLPLVLPPVVSGMVLLLLVGPNEPLGRLAATNGISLTRSLVGVVLAQTFVASPFLVVTAKASFEGVDRQLEHASRTLGKDRVTTFRRVTLPIAWPGVVGGMILTFARSLGEFGATVMLAYYPRTMPVQIWVSFTTKGIEHAFPVAIILIGVAITVLVLINLLDSTVW